MPRKIFPRNISQHTKSLHDKAIEWTAGSGRWLFAASSLAAATQLGLLRATYAHHPDYIFCNWIGNAVICICANNADYSSALEKLGGVWDTMPEDQPLCKKDDYYHTISLSPDKQRITFRHMKPIKGPEPA